MCAAAEVRSLSFAQLGVALPARDWSWRSFALALFTSAGLRLGPRPAPLTVNNVAEGSGLSSQLKAYHILCYLPLTHE